MEELHSLREQILEKDKVIGMIKEKTKSFVQKLKDDSNRELAKKDAEIAEHVKTCQEAEGRLAETLALLQQADQAKREADEEIMKAVGATETLANENFTYQKMCEELRCQLREKTDAEKDIATEEAVRIKREKRDAAEKDMVQKQVNLLEKEKDALTLELKNVSQDNARLTKQLSDEEERMVEMKKKTKTFVENLALEKETMSASSQANETKLRTVEKEKEEMALKLAMVTRKVEMVREEEVAKLEALQGQFEHRATEYLEQLKKSQAEAISWKKMAETEAQRAHTIAEQHEVKLGSNHKEMEDHKSKRIAARNEMIQLAETLESVHEEVAKLKHTIQFVLNPMVTDQIKGIESNLRALEGAMVQLSSSSPPSSSSFGLDRPVARFANIKSENGVQHSISLAGAKPMNTVRDAMQQADLLRDELARSQSGITLLSQAIYRLDTIARADKGGGYCCGLLGGGDTRSPRSAHTGTPSSNSFSSSSSLSSSSSSGTTSKRMSERLRDTVSAQGKGYDRLANSSHNDNDCIELSPHTPGGRFTIEDD